MHLPGSAFWRDSTKQWSQYEFILYVKQRYQVSRMLPRELPAEELDYHLDEETKHTEGGNVIDYSSNGGTK